AGARAPHARRKSRASDRARRRHLRAPLAAIRQGPQADRVREQRRGCGAQHVRRVCAAATPPQRRGRLQGRGRPQANRSVVPPACFIKHLHCQSALKCSIGSIRVFRPVSKAATPPVRRPCGGRRAPDVASRGPRLMQAAWTRVKKAQSRLWGDWMTIGEGLLEGRRWAMQVAGTNKPEGKGYVTAFGEWIKRYKVDDMDKSDRAKLL